MPGSPGPDVPGAPATLFNQPGARATVELACPVRCACLAAIASAALVVPGALVHEAGHAAACLAENPEAEWTAQIGLDGARAECPGAQNLPALYASGGLAAAGAALASAAAPQVRRRPFLLAAALATCSWQLLTAAAETLAHTWYMTSGAWPWLMPPVFAAAAALVCFGQRGAAGADPGKTRSRPSNVYKSIGEAAPYDGPL